MHTWLSCVLLLALFGVAATQRPQPAKHLFTLFWTKRSVYYTFIGSPTSGVTYKATFTPQTAGIPTPQTESINSPSLHNTYGLTPDVTYRLQVFAVLNGVESAAISANFTTLPDVPTGPPQSLTVADRTSTSITLTWRDPAPDRINDRDGATGFEVRKNGQRVANLTDRTYTFTGLTAATSYDFEVLAINEQGIAPDNHAAELTASTASGVPSPPTLQVILPKFSTIYLMWRDPEPFEGDITGLQILYLIDCVPQNIPELDGDANQFSVSGIKGSEGKTHSISLRARTSAGWGNYSTPVEFVFRPIVEVTVSPMGCNTLMVSYTVNPLPGDGNESTLRSLEVSYQPIFGVGREGNRSAALNGNTMDGVLCLSNLPLNTDYRITCGVEMEIGHSNVLLSDLSAPIEMTTGTTCNQLQCNEISKTRTKTNSKSPPTCSSTMRPSPTPTASNTLSGVLATLSECRAYKDDINCTDSCLHSKYRSFDGTCNNVKHPCYGAAEMAFLRLLEADYENGTNLPRGWSQSDPFSPPKPSARVISTQLFSTRNVTRHSHNTLMLMQIGQFLDHDMDHAQTIPSDKVFKNGSTCADLCGRELPCFPITIPPNDTRIRNRKCMAFTRSSTECESSSSSLLVGKATHPCEQINSITSFIDASMVYGSSENISNRLRESGTGRLSMGVESIPGKRFLPFVTDPVVECVQPLYSAGTSSSVPCFLAGDTRVNEHIALTSMHTLFYREHNRIADKLAELNPHWSHEKTYQEARKILGAEWQVIVYNHYIPNIVGPSGLQQLRQYEGYDSSVNPGIVNSFATAAYRFGHSQIMPIFPRFDENWEEISNGHIPLFQAFSSPFRLVQEGGIDPLIRGLISTPVKLRDAQQVLTTQVTERLFEESNDIGLDLGALNIQRGRDHGIPGYNQFRSYCSLSAAETFDDLATEIPDQEIRDKLQTLYGHPDNIDLIVGGMLEEVEEGGQLGPTFRCIIMDQFKRLRDGDRFWYQNPGVFTPFQVEELQKANLAKIICANADDIQQVPRDVFILQNVSEFVNCSEIEEVNLNAWKECEAAERCSQCESMRSKRSTGLWEAPGPDGLDIPNLVVQMNSSLHLLKKQFSSLEESPHSCRYGNEVYTTGAKWLPAECLSCSCQNGYVSCSRDC